MSELAQALLAVIQGGDTGFHELWGRMSDDVLFAEMQDALAELINAGRIRQIDRWHFCLVDNEA